MGKIKKILENELIGGTQSTDVYPVTSTKAVYDTSNKVLDDYIQHLKKTSTFAGIATPTTNPGTPDGNVFYLATEAGVYTHFDGISVAVEEVAILEWKGSWIKKTTDFATQQQIVRLDEKFDDKTNEINVAKEEALQAIAENEQSAITNFNAQKVTPEMLSESTKQLIEASGGGTITNLADDEDLTSIDDGTGSNVLKFADRTYNPNNFSGKGYKILRKNMADGKNILTQNMINDSNVTYEIKYDFDLAGAKIVMPKDCILKFNGGSISNGTIEGNNTFIENNYDITILDNVILNRGNDATLPWIGLIKDYWLNIDDNRKLDIAILFEKFIQTKDLYITDNINVRSWFNPNFKWVALNSSHLYVDMLNERLWILQNTTFEGDKNFSFKNLRLVDLNKENENSNIGFGISAYDNTGSLDKSYNVFIENCHIDVRQNSFGMVSSATTIDNKIYIYNSEFTSRSRFSIELWNSRCSVLKVYGSTFNGNTSFVQGTGKGGNSVQYDFYSSIINGGVELAEDETKAENIYKIYFYNSIINGGIAGYRQTYEAYLLNCSINPTNNSIYGLKKLSISNSTISNTLIEGKITIGKFVNDSKDVSRIKSLIINNNNILCNVDIYPNDEFTLNKNNFNGKNLYLFDNFITNESDINFRSSDKSTTNTGINSIYVNNKCLWVDCENANKDFEAIYRAKDSYVNSYGLAGYNINVMKFSYPNTINSMRVNVLINRPEGQNKSIYVSINGTQKNNIINILYSSVNTVVIYYNNKIAMMIEKINLTGFVKIELLIVLNKLFDVLINGKSVPGIQFPMLNIPLKNEDFTNANVIVNSNNDYAGVNHVEIKSI